MIHQTLKHVTLLLKIQMTEIGIWLICTPVCPENALLHHKKLMKRTYTLSPAKVTGVREVYN